MTTEPADLQRMSNKSVTPPTPDYTGLDEPLAAQLPTFELFFKTFGFKRVHGRVWGLLVLAGQALSSREIMVELSLSQGATSQAVHELTEWGAIESEFDSTRRCHLHRPVGNTLSIVATVFRRREQVVFGKFKVAATTTLEYVRERYGPKDPRVTTLRSIISSCEIGEAVMNLVFTSVERALGDSQSMLTKAVTAALKVGVKAPLSFATGARDERDRAKLASAVLQRLKSDPTDEDEDDEDDLEPGERGGLRA